MARRTKRWLACLVVRSVAAASSPHHVLPCPALPCRDVVEVGQFVDERQLRAAVAHRGSRASSRAASRVNSGVDLALLHEQEQQQLEEEQAEEAAEEESRQQPQQNGTAAHQAAAKPVAAAAAPAGRRTSGGGGSARKQPVEYMVRAATLPWGCGRSLLLPAV
jgi:hypothetical protein